MESFFETLYTKRGGYIRRVRQIETKTWHKNLLVIKTSKYIYLKSTVKKNLKDNIFSISRAEDNKRLVVNQPKF